ncbi:MAG: hypothetical protein QOH13_1682 [Thermoleophilaceae bacterium]|jgi:hypothetical protein|nr:hypothetical protein [Thermoleophilaceae bacterium]
MLGAKRTELVSRLERLPLGQTVTLQLVNGERLRGKLRDCNGIKVVMTDGRSVPVRTVQGVSTSDAEDGSAGA